MVRGIIGGLIGGAIGAAIWATVSLVLHVQVGIVAWGVGALVGIGVAAGSRQEGGTGMGVVAALIALASIATGKYATLNILIDRQAKEDLSDAALSDHLDKSFTDEKAKMYMARTLMDEGEKAGKTYKWPEGKDLESAEKGEDYPKAVWADVETRWTGMKPDAREKYMTDAKQAMLVEMHESAAQMVKDTKQYAFSHMFHVFDALWALLAIGSAFRIAQSESD